MSLEDEDDRTKEKDIEAGVDLDIQEEATDQAPHDQEIATEEGITIVTWDSPSDPAKPTNWPTTLRWTLISLCTAVVFCGGISSSIFAPGVPQLMKEFNSSSDILAIFVVSVYVLGLGTGPAIFAPLSEIYGRLPVQHVGNIGFLGFTIACALATNLKMLIGFRLLQGVFAAVPLTNGGGIIADMVKQEERGFALAMFTLGLLTAPVIGPLVGGLLTEAKGWRWSFWVSAMMIAVPLVLTFFLWRRESYHPILLARKAARLRDETGNPKIRSEYDTGRSPAAHFKHSIGRAIKMLLFSPIVLFFALYMGLVYSYFYLLLTTLTTVFESVYHFKTSLVGLSYLGLGSGYLVGQFAFAWLSDRILKAKARKDPNGEMKPEYRLPLAVVGGCSVPIAFFWYGWSAQTHTHWIVPIIGPGFLGFGNSLIFMSIQAYTVDAFTIFAASALAANTITRSIMAAVIPLAAPRMYATLGLGWGNSLLAFLALAMVPIPFFLMKYGEKMRLANAERMRQF